MQWMLSLVLFCLEQILLSFSLPLPKREQKVCLMASAELSLVVSDCDFWGGVEFISELPPQ